jgi:pyrroline-5-carboxylate reductase
MDSTPVLAGVAAKLAFIGGGNMAGAMIGGCLKAGRARDAIVVVEPQAERAEALRREYGIEVLPAPDTSLARAGMVVWAVKPQIFGEAAPPCAPHVAGALHLSVMAGIRCGAIARQVGSARIVRAMPNTPALIGRGVAGVYADAAVSAADRGLAEAVLGTTGLVVWVEREADLEAVTAVSGSGPAYVFYLVEAMIRAGVALGLSAEQSRRLALATVDGAAALAEQTGEAPEVLRQRVTSPGGTTHAAISTLDAHGVGDALLAAMRAAARRAGELGDQFGG